MSKNIKHGIQTVISDTSTTTLSQDYSESSQEEDNLDLKKKFLENVNKNESNKKNSCFIKSILNSTENLNLKYSSNEIISSSESEISSVEEFSLVK